jgi:hypothetical protein
VISGQLGDRTLIVVPLLSKPDPQDPECVLSQSLGGFGVPSPSPWILNSTLEELTEGDDLASLSGFLDLTHRDL